MKVLHYLSSAFSVTQHVPVVSRVVDLSTSALAGLMRCFSGGWIAGGAEKRQRPSKPIMLFEFEGCPFCRRVRETLSVLALDVTVYPCPKETMKGAISTEGSPGNSRFRPEVLKHGGKQLFPYLVDENTGVHMYESAEINKYLWKTYGADTTVPWTYWLGEKVFKVTMPFPTLFRPLLTHGMLRVPSKAPKEPLELWGCEGSPFVRLVREALCCLELPYVYRQVPHGELLNRGEFREKFGAQLSLPRQQLGAVQMPFLRDANTGTDLLESADIVEYLYKTYQDGPLSSETWLDFSFPKPSSKAD